LDKSLGKKEVLDWGGRGNAMIEQIFFCLKIISKLFVQNSKSPYSNNGLVYKLKQC
jgi:hypothetical protein